MKGCFLDFQQVNVSPFIDVHSALRGIRITQQTVSILMQKFHINRQLVNMSILVLIAIQFNTPVFSGMRFLKISFGSLNY